MTWQQAASKCKTAAENDRAAEQYAQLAAIRRALRNDPESIHPTPPCGF